MDTPLLTTLLLLQGLELLVVIIMVISSGALTAVQLDSILKTMTLMVLFI